MGKDRQSKQRRGWPHEMRRPALSLLLLLALGARTARATCREEAFTKDDDRNDYTCVPTKCVPVPGDTECCCTYEPGKDMASITVFEEEIDVGKGAEPLEGIIKTFQTLASSPCSVACRRRRLLFMSTPSHCPSDC